MAVDFRIIGKRIKMKRKEKNMTQEALAEKLYVSVGYISNMERGTTKINLSTLSDIADVLDCDISEFVSEASVYGKTYMFDEINELVGRLDENERRTLSELLKTYLSNK